MNLFWAFKISPHNAARADSLSCDVFPLPTNASRGMTITLVACVLRSKVSIAPTIDAPIMSRSLFPGVQFWTINEVLGETFLCLLADCALRARGWPLSPKVQLLKGVRS